MFVFFRLEWESAILRGCSTFRRMEEDRLNQLRYLNPSQNFQFFIIKKILFDKKQKFRKEINYGKHILAQQNSLII